MADTFMHPATTAEERKASPVWSGLHGHFPAACELVARLSKKGNDKHNPGQPLQHARGKSNDHADCLLRHQRDVGTIDEEMGLDHAVAVAWRALAQLQELAERQYGWPVAPNARGDEVKPAIEIVGPPDLYESSGNEWFLYEIRSVAGARQARAVAKKDGSSCSPGSWHGVGDVVLTPYRR